MNDQERLQKLLSFLGLSANALSKEIGWKQPQTFYDIRRGKIHISKRLADTIVNTFNQIDKRWLLTGNGDMLKPDLQKESLRFMSEDASGNCGSMQNGEAVIISRDVFEQMCKLTDTILMQQRRIEVLEKELESK